MLAIVALYEHVVHTHGLAVGPSFCNLSEHINCEKVNTSPWSSFFGLPVASWGIFFYLAVSGLSVSSGMARSGLFAGLLVAAGAVATVVSLALFAISEFVIGALCLVCVGMYLVNLFLFLVALGLVYRWRAGDAVSGGGIALRDFFAALAGSGDSSVVSHTRMYMAWVLIALGFAAASPRIVLGLAHPPPSTRPTTSDALVAWKTAPVVAIPSEITTGLLGDHVKGDPGAPVTIVEFADFECYGCRVLYQEMKLLLERYKGKYHFAFHHYPLDSSCNPNIGREFHRYACLASQFARCAGEQGAFWEAADYLFSFEGLESKLPLEQVKARLLDVGAVSLGLDADAIRDCIASGRHNEKISLDIALGDKLGIPGTPSIFVNGRAVPHPTSIALQKIFDTILQSSPTQGTPLP
jgi:protein-disulfide isomerase